jgi:hypothetical protein
MTGVAVFFIKIFSTLTTTECCTLRKSEGLICRPNFIKKITTHNCVYTHASSMVRSVGLRREGGKDGGGTFRPPI